MIEKTYRFQDNAVMYKNKVYFLNKRSLNNGVDGGFEELYKIYLNE